MFSKCSDYSLNTACGLLEDLSHKDEERTLCNRRTDRLTSRAPVGAKNYQTWLLSIGGCWCLHNCLWSWYSKKCQIDATPVNRRDEIGEELLEMTNTAPGRHWWQTQSGRADQDSDPVLAHICPSTVPLKMQKKSVNTVFIIHYTPLLQQAIFDFVAPTGAQEMLMFVRSSGPSLSSLSFFSNLSSSQSEFIHQTSVSH